MYKKIDICRKQVPSSLQESELESDSDSDINVGSE